jgi:hypothetical protein
MSREAVGGRPYMIASPYDVHDGQPVMDTVYTRCLSCGIVAQPAASSSA